MAEGFKIISTGLLTAQVSVDTHISGGSREGFPLAVRNMLLRLRVTILLGHAEVDNMDYARGLGAGTADQKVVGLDIAINQILLVDGLDP